MPSIFIWKATSPNNSKKTIRFYSGSNWTLEDNDYSSKSYIYLEQIVITESGNSVITFKSKDMPQDWVGSELLEVSSVPYEMVKSDKYGTLEKVGDWMRFISKNEIEFEKEILQNEFNQIKKWINQTKQPNMHKTHCKPTHTFQDSIDSQKIQMDFKDFLNKYNIPVTLNIDIPTSSINLKNTNKLHNLENGILNHNKETKYKQYKKHYT